MPISKEQMKITIKFMFRCRTFENFLQATQSVALEELKSVVGKTIKRTFDRIFSQIKAKGIVKARLCGDQRHQIYLAFAKPNTNANEESVKNTSKTPFLSYASFTIARKIKTPLI